MDDARDPGGLPPAEAELPLTPLAFEILLALLAGEAHGYAIMQAVEARLAGGVVHAGTLYRALARLTDGGLTEEVDAGADAGGGRRRYYRVTPRGRQVVAAEARRLEEQVAAARAHGLLGDSARA